MTLAIILTLVALILVMLELTFPSFGILSLGAATAYAFALVNAFAVGETTGWTFVVVGVVTLPIAIAVGFKVIPHTPIGRMLFLQGPKPEDIQHGTTPSELSQLIGVTGEAITDLRPSGVARISGRRVDVVASGRFVPKGSTVSVSDVDGTRVVVRATES